VGLSAKCKIRDDSRHAATSDQACTERNKKHGKRIMIRRHSIYFLASLLALSGCASPGEQRKPAGEREPPTQTVPHYATVNLADRLQREEAAKEKEAAERNSRIHV